MRSVNMRSVNMLSVNMLNVQMLSVIMLSVNMQSVIILSVNMLSVIKLNVIMLSVIMLNAIILNDVVPSRTCWYEFVESFFKSIGNDLKLKLKSSTLTSSRVSIGPSETNSINYLLFISPLSFGREH